MVAHALINPSKTDRFTKLDSSVLLAVTGTLLEASKHLLLMSSQEKLIYKITRVFPDTEIPGNS